MDHFNMPLREKINIIGAAPGITEQHLRKRKRKAESEFEDEEEEEEDEGFSLKKRRRQRKKQKNYFKTLSEAGSASEMDPTSPRKSSHSGERCEIIIGLFDGIHPAGRSSLSTDHEDQSGVSDEGYIMDMSLVAKLIDNFDKPEGKKGLSGQLSDFYAPVKLENITREKFRKLPSCLDMANLGTYCWLICFFLSPP